MFPSLKGYKKKNVGNGCILYFDPKQKDSVVAVEASNLEGIEGKTLTFVLYDVETAKYFLCVQLEKEDEFSAIPIRLSDIFVITDRSKVITMDLIGQVPKTEKRISIPKIVYNVSNYCALDDPDYKGYDFSELLLLVYLGNSAGQIYKTSMKVGKGVICCDGNPWGTIDGAYQFKTPLLTKFQGRITQRR